MGSNHQYWEKRTWFCFIHGHCRISFAVQSFCFFFTVRFDEVRCVTTTAGALLRVETETSGTVFGVRWSLGLWGIVLLCLLIMRRLLLAWRRGQRMTVDLRRHFLQQELVVFLYDLIDRGLRLGWVLLVDTGPLPQMALTTIRWSWNRGSPYQDQCGSESGSSQEAVIGDHDAVQDRRKQEMHEAKKYYRPLEGGPDRYL